MRSEQAKKGWSLLINGMVAVLYAADSRKDNVFLNVFNGETDEGYTQNRYMKAFAFSFDDEVYRFKTFLDERLGILLDSSYRDFIESLAAGEPENIITGITGFELMKEGLSLLDECRANEPKEDWNFKQWDDSEDIPNPFANITLHQFRLAVDGWIRAFGKELKEQIGRRTYDAKKKQALVHAEKWMQHFQNKGQTK